MTHVFDKVLVEFDPIGEVIDRLACAFDSRLRNRVDDADPVHYLIEIGRRRVKSNFDSSILRKRGQIDGMVSVASNRGYTRFTISVASSRYWNH